MNESNSAAPDASSATPPLDALPRVIIYTDGAAEPNPGPGGYGVVLMAGQHRKELSGGFRKTTNNRMELMGVIVALESLTRRCRVLLFSDSKYVVDSYTRGSVYKWQKKNWFRTGSERAKNADLWQRFLLAVEKHDVEFRWVKGHAGVAENERCDVLAVAATQGYELPHDFGYLREIGLTPDDPAANPFRHASASHRSADGPPPPADTSRDSDATSPKRTEALHIKHEHPGEPCRKCGTPLIKKPTKSHPRKPGQTYCYDWYLHCPGCNTMYMVDSAKRMF
jgi:ribonuclease HI